MPMDDLVFVYDEEQNYAFEIERSAPRSANTWEDARNACAARRMRLATIDEWQLAVDTKPDEFNTEDSIEEWIVRYDRFDIEVAAILTKQRTANGEWLSRPVVDDNITLSYRCAAETEG